MYSIFKTFHDTFNRSFFISLLNLGVQKGSYNNIRLKVLMKDINEIANSPTYKRYCNFRRRVPLFQNKPRVVLVCHGGGGSFSPHQDLSVGKSNEQENK